MDIDLKAFERLSKMKDAWSLEDLYPRDTPAGRMDRLEADVTALLARVEELEGALRPFASAGKIWMTANETDDCKVFCDVWAKPPLDLISDPEFTVGDFRRAARAYAGGEKQE